MLSLNCSNSASAKIPLINSINVDAYIFGGLNSIDFSVWMGSALNGRN